MGIQRPCRLALACLGWVTAVLAFVIQVLSGRGLILSICPFGQSHNRKDGTGLARWTGQPLA